VTIPSFYCYAYLLLLLLAVGLGIYLARDKRVHTATLWIYEDDAECGSCYRMLSKSKLGTNERSAKKCPFCRGRFIELWLIAPRRAQDFRAVVRHMREVRNSRGRRRYLPVNSTQAHLI